MLFPFMSIERNADHVFIALVRTLMIWVRSQTAIVYSYAIQGKSVRKISCSHTNSESKNMHIWWS